MRLPEFELVEPTSVAEALAALAERDGEARLVAGGTALVPMIRLGLLRPGRLVSLDRVTGLRRVRVEGGQLELGAMVPVAAVHRSSEARAGWPLLAEACGRVATPAIRSAATLGGNLAYAEAASDPAPALLCLEGEVQVAGPGGARAVAATAFFRGFYETALEPGEMVTGVRVPPPPRGSRGGYVKCVSRSAEDKPLIGVAALLTLDGAGRHCEELRIGLAGAAPTPLRARRAEARARGEALSDGAIHEVAEAAAAEADPLSDLMGTAGYRREMIRVWVRRLLTALRDGHSLSPPGRGLG